MNRFYRQRAKQFSTINNEPTLTDQSAANETFIHTIVQRATVSGQIPATTKEAQYLDWTQIPTTLTNMIQLARTSKEARKKLPKALQNMSDAELFALTYNELNAILTPQKPADEPPANQKD